MSWEEIVANLNPEEIKSFYENRITEEEEKEAMDAWEKYQAYELRVKSERDFMNEMAYAENEGFVKEYIKVNPEGEEEAIMKAAKSLMRKGYSIELIRKYTGLTDKEIQEIEPNRQTA